MNSTTVSEPRNGLADKADVIVLYLLRDTISFATVSKKLLLMYSPNAV